MIIGLIQIYLIVTGIASFFVTYPAKVMTTWILSSQNATTIESTSIKYQTLRYQINV